MVQCDLLPFAFYIRVQRLHFRLRLPYTLVFDI